MAKKVFVSFDIDGTLLDTEKYTILSKIIEGKKYGYDISEEVVIKSLGMAKEVSNEYYTSIYGKDFPCEELRNSRFDYIVEALKNNKINYK